jgi:hypothetical protein
MRHQKGITENKTWPWPMAVLFLFSAFFIFAQAVLAQKEPEIHSEPFKINGKEVKEYLMEKYKLHKDDVRSEILQTPNGPSGELHINSFEKPITPPNVVVTEGTVEGRARAIAQAFFRDEASFLGITAIDEIREVRINTIKGDRGQVTSVHYRRYINNVELENMHIRITVGTEETITNMSANLVAPPLELYEAVRKKTLTENEIRQIIKQDLGATKDLTGMKISEIKKVAIPSPPYIVWTANAGVKSDHGMWGYRIDAFTGEIIKKGYVVIH